MKIDIHLLPIPPEPGSISNHSVVVLDILRATSVIVHALSEGAKEFVPVLSVEEAFGQKGKFPFGTTFLGGEQDTQPIEGFDLGNSPKEYTSEKIRDKRIVLRTTNGTRAFHLVSAGKEVMVGSFFNIEATAERCIRLGWDLLIFPSGDEGHFSLEDTVCGGMIIDLILKKGRRDIGLTDASHAAQVLFKRFEGDLLEAFRLSHHGNKLIRLGRGDDLPYCAQTNIISIVPVFKDGAIRVPHPTLKVWND
jgi:2-phosphosulfolactate phosphatase